MGAPSSDMRHVQCDAPRQANAGPLHLITRACSGSHGTQAAPSADTLYTSDVTATSATTATRALGGSTSTFGRLALVFRLRTGVSLAGIPVYFLIGIVAIVSTVPSLVLGGRWIPYTVPGWDWLAAIARTSAEVGASPTFAAALAMMAKVGLALFPLVPMAALLRALRAKSRSHSARRWAPRG